MPEKQQQLKKVFNELCNTNAGYTEETIVFSSEELEKIRQNAVSQGQKIIDRKKIRDRILYSTAAMLVLGLGIFTFFSNSIFNRNDTYTISDLNLPQGELYQVNDQILMGGLENARFSLQYSDTLEIRLHEGHIFISREQPNSKFIVKTRLAQYIPVGTLFTVKTGFREEIILGEGEIIVASINNPAREIRLKADGPRFAEISANSEINFGNYPPAESPLVGDIKILEALKKQKNVTPNNFAEILKVNEQKKLPEARVSFTDNSSRKTQESFSAFKPGDCVFYFRDSDRLQGEVKNVANTGIRIQRGGVLEDNIFNPAELTPCR